MSDLRDLLEKMDAMSAAERKPTGPRWPGYLKGTDSAKKSRSRMVGDGAAESVEESNSLIKELSEILKKNPIKQDLFTEWQQYKKISEQGPTDRVRAIQDPNDPDNYDTIRFQKMQPDGNIVDIEPYSGTHRSYYSKMTGKEPGQSPLSKQMQDTLTDLLQKSTVTSGPTIKEPQSPFIQDIPVKIKQKQSEPDEDIISEYGAPGSGISGEPGAAEDKAQKDQIRMTKQQIKDQIVGLVAQLQASRAELAALNKQFPQGANPVEKTMMLQQMNAQKIGIKKQIEDLTKQIAALRQQAI